MWCVVLNGKDTLLVGCIYRSPNSDRNNNENLYDTVYNENLNETVYNEKLYDTVYNENLNETVRQANNLGFSYILIFENFNYPSINWDDVTSPPEGIHQSALFLEAVRDSFIWQHMAERTHGTPNILDLTRFLNSTSAATRNNIQTERTSSNTIRETMTPYVEY